MWGEDGWCSVCVKEVARGGTTTGGCFQSWRAGESWGACTCSSNLEWFPTACHPPLLAKSLCLLFALSCVPPPPPPSSMLCSVISPLPSPPTCTNYLACNHTHHTFLFSPPHHRLHHPSPILALPSSWVLLLSVAVPASQLSSADYGEGQCVMRLGVGVGVEVMLFVLCVLLFLLVFPVVLHTLWSVGAHSAFPCCRFLAGTQHGGRGLCSFSSLFRAHPLPALSFPPLFESASPLAAWRWRCVGEVGGREAL